MKICTNIKNTLKNLTPKLFLLMNYGVLRYESVLSNIPKISVLAEKFNYISLYNPEPLSTDIMIFRKPNFQ